MNFCQVNLQAIRTDYCGGLHYTMARPAATRPAYPFTRYVNDTVNNLQTLNSPIWQKGLLRANSMSMWSIDFWLPTKIDESKRCIF